MNQNALEFQEAKLVRLEAARRENKPAFELDILSHAIAKCKRRIERMREAPKPVKDDEGAKDLNKERKLTRNEKERKRKDYEKRRKNRYKEKEKQDGR
jgi:hypothetical protein